ncbi:SH3 domain-containing protein [Acetobacteraceae bacterium KSS8]|uniref:SH3 domain-containing protein n=1 Tax=Endosaccharibacter trunci TaxID=2812733 RepID=A0ABT1WA54_9PROT|nr:SH3 domain-containing protein [Acetobacteraceae bacterium KSS8]
MAALFGLMAILVGAPALAQDQPTHHAAHKTSHETGHEPSRDAHRPGHAVRHRTEHAPAHNHAHAAPAHHRAPVAAPAVPPKPVPAPVAAPPAPAPPPVPAKGTSTGLPLPRFASLRADAVNLRGGPGTRYPIQWVYKRRDLPVKIEREFDVWRLVEDSDGVKGWVHQATLMGTRTFVIPGGPGSDGSTAAAASDAPLAAPDTVGEVHNLGSSNVPTVAGRLASPSSVLPAGSVALRAQPQPDGNLVAVLMPGIVGRIRSCPPGSGWCKVSVRDYSGWLPRSAFWGLLPDETILPP